MREQNEYTFSEVFTNVPDYFDAENQTSEEYWAYMEELKRQRKEEIETLKAELEVVDEYICKTCKEKYRTREQYCDHLEKIEKFTCSTKEKKCTLFVKHSMRTRSMK
jgi:YesN/AraC family two-component response regulator